MPTRSASSSLSRVKLIWCCAAIPWAATMPPSIACPPPIAPRRIAASRAAAEVRLCCCWSRLMRGGCGGCGGEGGQGGRDERRKQAHDRSLTATGGPEFLHGYRRLQAGAWLRAPTAYTYRMSDAKSASRERSPRTSVTCPEC